MMGVDGEMEDIKIGVIEKLSFEDGPHMVIRLEKETVEKETERIWVEGPLGVFRKEDLKEGVLVEIKGKDIGTIIGECDFGDIGYLPLFEATDVRIINKNNKVGRFENESRV